MFTPEQKKYIHDNSVKVNEHEKYIEIMGYFEEYFTKLKFESIKRKFVFVFTLLMIVFIICQLLLLNVYETRVLIFRGAAIFVGALILLKLELMLLNYIDERPIIKKIYNKECDMLYYEGDLNNVTKFINYKSTNSALYDYFIIVSGNKYEIDKALYKVLLPDKGKKIRIYYFAELLNRQMLISDAAIFMVIE